MAYEIKVGEAMEGAKYTRGSSPTIRVPFRVERVPSARDISEQLREDEAYAALMSQIPTIFRGLLLTELEAESNSVDGWLYTALYTRRNRPQIGFMDYSGDSTGGTANITTAIATLARYSRSGGPSPDPGNGINWDGTKFEGTEIPAPSFRWSETWGHNVGPASEPYIQTCIRNTAGVNVAPFRGWAAGEVLFTGVTNTLEVVEDSETGTFAKMWKLTFNFEVSPNYDDIFVGEIGPIRKRGWDYLWAMYSQKKDENTGQVISRPEFAFTQQLLRYFDFSVLGIGIGPISSVILG